MVLAEPTAPRAREDVRERILSTAYDLFCRHGTRAVGIDRVIAEAGVAKMSMYRHFHSKDELILAVLERRAQRWTIGFVQREVAARADTPAAQLLVMFDVFDEWFRRPDFEGCTFVNVLLEVADSTSEVHQASREHLRVIRAYVRDLAAAAGVADPDRFASQWHILLKGSIVAAGEGDVEAARAAGDVAALLLERELPTRS